MKREKMHQYWTPGSWRKKSSNQIPVYPDKNALGKIEQKLSSYPPLVTIDEVLRLKSDLAKVSKGQAFLLQGGDCAETFTEFKASTIKDTFRVLLQMSIVFNFAGGKNIIRVGRFAGQFAKPRSSDVEEKDGITLPNYRGDIINSFEFDEKTRIPDPERLLKAYFQSTATLNFLRAFSHGKYADLDLMLKWMLHFIKKDTEKKHYNALEKKIYKTLNYIEAKGITKEGMSLSRKNIDFYTSHEELLPHYEEPLTRQDPIMQEYVATSAHFLWIGDRTCDSEGAQVEFLRGVVNPIGIKCGPNLKEKNLLTLLDILNPKNEPGRITLISRMGKGNVKKNLIPLIRAVQKSGNRVIWSCDPMHGNTKQIGSGQKTRYFDDIFSEVTEFFEVCEGESVYPGALHLEMTGKNVTECLGGSRIIDLTQNYETQCDPRLNGKQALELAFKVSELLKEN